jgi:hypothetical protein
LILSVNFIPQTLFQHKNKHQVAFLFLNTF